MTQTRCDDDVLTVPAVTQARGTVKLPGSKSISNRALLLAALCTQRTRLTGLLQAEDTERMLDSLHLLGASIEQNAEECTIAPGNDFPLHEAELFVGNAGTVSRMLTAFLRLPEVRTDLTVSSGCAKDRLPILWMHCEISVPESNTRGRSDACRFAFCRDVLFRIRHVCAVMFQVSF